MNRCRRLTSSRTRFTHVCCQGCFGGVRGEPTGTIHSAALSTLERGTASDNYARLRGFIQLSDWLAKRRSRGLIGFGRKCVPGTLLTWTSLESATTKALESLAGYCQQGQRCRLGHTGRVSRAQLLADAADLLAHLESGGGLGFWVFRGAVSKRCKYLWRDTRFQGERCDSPPCSSRLIAHLRAQETLDRAWQEWSVHR